MSRREYYATPLTDLIEMSYAKAEMNVTQRLQTAEATLVAISSGLGDPEALKQYSEIIIPVSQRLKEMTASDVLEHNNRALEELFS